MTAADFIVDTAGKVIDADISVNGVQIAKDTPLFDIGAGLVLTPTASIVATVNTAFGPQPISTALIVGSASTNPIFGAAAVPEPETLGLLVASLAGLVATRRRA